MVNATAVILTVIWNCRNLATASFTDLPHAIAVTIDLKLSSSRIIALASLAISVPLRPIEKPTSAAFSAGPSFVPSPVTATVSPRVLRCWTRMRLSSGEERARTCRRGITLVISSAGSLRNWGPSMTRPVGVLIPHDVAMDVAVFILSPARVSLILQSHCMVAFYFFFWCEEHL